jgi:hypothetical protein
LAFDTILESGDDVDHSEWNQIGLEETLRPWFEKNGEEQSANVDA